MAKQTKGRRLALLHQSPPSVSSLVGWLVPGIIQKADDRLGVLGPLRNMSGPPIRYGVLLYKQLIRPVVDWACPIWRSAAHTQCQEDVCDSILISSHGHRYTLVHWQKANSRGFGTSILGRLLRLKFNWNGEALILATRQIRWPSVDQGRLKRKLSVTDQQADRGRPQDGGQFGTTNRAQRCSARHFSSTLAVGFFRDFS